MVMSHDEPGSKHQITVKKKKKKKSKMNDNAFRDKEKSTNFQLRPNNIQHIILSFLCSSYCLKQSAPPILTAQKDRYVDDFIASHKSALVVLRIHLPKD